MLSIISITTLSATAPLPAPPCWIPTSTARSRFSLTESPYPQQLESYVQHEPPPVHAGEQTKTCDINQRVLVWYGLTPTVLPKSGRGCFATSSIQPGDQRARWPVYDRASLLVPAEAETRPRFGPFWATRVDAHGYLEVTR